MTQLPSPLGPNPSLPSPLVASAFDSLGGGVGTISVVNQSTLAAGATQFSGFAFGWNATENLRQIPLPECTVTQIIMRTSNAQPAGQNLTVTVRKNGVDQGIVLVIPGGAAAGLFTASGVISFAEGDLFSLKGVQDAGASASANVIGTTTVYVGP